MDKIALCLPPFAWRTGANDSLFCEVACGVLLLSYRDEAVTRPSALSQDYGH